MLTVLALPLLAAAALQRVADPCAAQQPGASVTARVVTGALTSRDSLVRATVCVVPARAAAATKVGSYHGELHYNPAAYTLASVEKAEGGVRVENATIAGQVNFAGAAPSGFPGRALVTVVLKVRNPAQRPALRLSMKELNSTEGKSLMQGLVVAETPR